MNTSPPQLSLVIPCFNESGVLPLLRKRLSECLPRMNMTWEVIFVDDGSHDDTLQQLTAMHEADSRFKVLSFSRNFGHQTAVFAGLTQACGEFVAVLDADLQDPPEFIATCVNKLNEGFDVVYAVRRNRKENLLKKMAYAGFYRLLKFIAEVKIPLDSGDFCVMRQCVVSVLRSMPEHDVFVRGLRAWSGFRQVGLEYERHVRCAGVTKYPFRKLVKLALDGVFAFSTFPLHLASYIGFLSVAGSMIASVFLFIWWLLGFRLFGHYPSEVPGWTSLACLILFLGGIQFLILGVQGEFIRRIHTGVQQRPRWIIKKSLGFDSEPPKKAKE